MYPDHPRTSPCGGRCVGPPVGGSSPHSMFACRFRSRLVSAWHLGVEPAFVDWDGTRPETRQPEEYEPGCTRGWQHEAASRVDQRFRNEDLFARLTHSGSSSCAISGRTWCWPCAVHLSHMSRHEDRPSALQGHPVAPPPSPSSLDRAFLPVWPSTRRLWPPPCSLRSGWGLGKEGVRSGDGDCSHLSRSRWPGDD